MNTNTTTFLRGALANNFIGLTLLPLFLILFSFQLSGQGITIELTSQEVLWVDANKCGAEGPRGAWLSHTIDFTNNPVLVDDCDPNTPDVPFSIGVYLDEITDHDEQLTASTSFQHHKKDLRDSPQDQLIRYSLQDEERSWQEHYNSIVGPENNSIHPSGIEYLSLWMTAPISTLIFEQSTFSLI